MIKYQVSTQNPHRHFIAFDAVFPTNNSKVLLLQIAAWRPGRYELGNFSKNIRGWNASTLNGKSLPFRKLNKDLWEVECDGLDQISIRYEYYAAELNAGSSYLDEDQLYINPVNCFFYVQQRPDLAFEIAFDFPSNYRIACGLDGSSSNVLKAKNFDELADCPLIASATIKHLDYGVSETTYHIWIQGDVKLDETRLLHEFSEFTQSHIRLFGDIPCKEYHFLFHFTPYFIRHGVEHSNSTVIAMGPAADFQGDALHKDLLGISCHELFHTWNVKNIRPIEMMPYDFTKENYSRLGYVYEGVTTYYGDLLLWRSGAISDVEWFQAIEERLQTHFDNPGRFNLSVADSSFDTWLDGYSSGIPRRKVSIYNEGFLIALMCDLFIIHQSEGKDSLNSVMKDLYDNFGKKSVGYTETDYRNCLTNYLGSKATILFDQLINGTEDYFPFLVESLGFAGVAMSTTPSPKWTESNLGLFLDEVNQKITVSSIVPGSPADDAKLWIGDEILSVNGTAPYKNAQQLFRMSEQPLKIDFVRKGKFISTTVFTDGEVWSKRWKTQRMENANASQSKVFEVWRYV